MEDTVISNEVEVTLFGVGHYVTSMDTRAEIKQVIVGPGGCEYYVGEVEDYPRPVMWDERGRDMCGHCHLVGPADRPDPTLKECWVLYYNGRPWAAYGSLSDAKYWAEKQSGINPQEVIDIVHLKEVN